MVTSPKVKCICGSNEFSRYEKDHYEVTEKGETIKASSNGIMFGSCDNCGIVRLIKEPMKDYKNYPPSNECYGAKDYAHDEELAKKRCNAYVVMEDDKVLDVGSGSGAFVDEARARGAEAYGCEITKYHYEKNNQFIYRKALEDIYFPTDTFDKVTCHDVLEHVAEPIKFVNELFRITRQECECIIDYPMFYGEEGKHHWKREHVWYLTTEQVVILLESAGFELNKIDHPIPSKVVIYFRKPKQERVKILVPPGMGDAYWSIVKLESFLEQRGIDSPVDIYIACNKERKWNGHRRAFPYIKLFPFLHSTGIAYSTNDYPQSMWLEAYRDPGRTIFEDVCGCDYFISYNAWVGAGTELEAIDPDIKCNWFPNMFTSLDQINYMNSAKKQYGEYIVFYFIFHGHYREFTAEFSIDAVVESVDRITKETGKMAVFTGAIWDEENDLLGRVVKRVPNCIDLRGKTSIQELFGLIQGSEIVVGYPSGLTIMSTVLRAKTLMIWNDFYNDDFRWNSCPPDTRNDTYFIEDTKGLTPKKLTSRVKELIND